MRSILAAVAVASLPTLASTQNQGIQLTAGVDGAVEVPFDAAMVPPTGLTVEAWITFDESTVPVGAGFYWPTIARQNIAPGGESWLLRVGSASTSNRNVEFSVRSSAATLNVLTYAFAPGEFLQFTHLAATYDGQIMTIYKNGVQVAQSTLPAATEVLNNGGILRIGNGDASVAGRETWNGIIDELRIWPMPRTGAEILATMNQELMAMPGNVVTFNFNGNYFDSSHSLIGNAIGSVAFAPGVPNLPMVMPVALNFGHSTTTCARSIDALFGSAPALGNAAFAIWCVKGPRPANSALSLLAAGGVSAPPGQPPLFGVDLVFTPASVLATTTFVPGTQGLGNVRFPLPLPNLPALSGASAIFQFGFVDAQCGPQGFSASNGLVFTIF